MLLDDGKQEILNFLLKKFILEFDLYLDSIKEEIMNRVIEYVEYYLKLDEVLVKFENIRCEFNLFFEKILFDIFEMEKEWINN